MTSGSCYACGSALEVKSPGRADCTNRACPGGRAFSFCGFCKEHSFSLEKSYCFNPDCRMCNIKRTDCPICNRMSVISVQGRPLCINRDCSSNRKIVTECYFCHNRSFLNSPGAMFCTKGDCPYLLQTVYRCYSCEELSFDVSQNSCKNPECEHFNVEITQCEKCKERSFVIEDGHSQFQLCINENCELSKPGAEQKPLGELKAKQLKGMLRDTLALPLDMASDRESSDASEVQTTPDSDEPTPIYGTEQAPSEELRTEPIEQYEPEQPAPEPMATLDVSADEEAEKESELQTEPVQEPSPEQELADQAEHDEKFEEPPERVAKEKREDKARLGDLVYEEPELERFEKPQTVVPKWAEREASAAEDLDLLGEPDLAPDTQESGQDSPVGAFEAEASAKKGSRQPTDKDDSSFFGDEPAEGGSRGLAFVQKGAVPLISEVFGFVSEHILKDEKGQRYPLYLVIGLSGSGKTTYLTMLGDILANKSMKYYFPYEGVDVKRTVVEKIFEKSGGSSDSNLLEALKLRVKDLVYSFAQKHYADYIGKMRWSPATARERTSIESASEVSTYFLVTELRKYNRTIAKIVTIETSGEDYEEIIKGITQYRQAEKSGSPLQRVLIEMMDHAQGFVVLVDPANEENDSLYQNLFLVLKESLESRALNCLSELVRERIDKYTQDVGSKMEQDDLRKAIAQMKKAREQKELRKREFERIKSKLTEQLGQVAARFEEEGLDMLLGEAGDFIRRLEKIFAKLSPEAAKAVQKKVKERKEDPKVLKSYYSGMIKQCLANTDSIAEFQYKLHHKDEADVREAGELISRAIKEIYQEIGIPESFRLELDEDLGSDRPVKRFQNLQYLAIAVTKSDMYPIIYPPEKYPEKKLAKSKRHLEAVENYLRLCGGDVRFYNTSATGYSILKDTLFYPGKENTHSPINVVEPIFDMLHITQVELNGKDAFPK